MKNRISYNKKSGIISIHNNIKNFDIYKVIKLLQVEKLTLYFEYTNVSKSISIESLEGVFTLDEHSLVMQIENFQDVFRRIIEGNKIDSVILIDGLMHVKVVDDLIEVLNNQSIRFFLDVNWGENEVHLLINSKCYNSELIEKIKLI